jgi:uncharacterized protein YodC (DUF2158 family)
MEFAAGDTVQLKSGGPFMTVEQVGEHWSIKGPAVWCVWFEKVGKQAGRLARNLPLRRAR